MFTIVVQFSDMDIDVVPAAGRLFQGIQTTALSAFPTAMVIGCSQIQKSTTVYIADANQQSRGKLRAVAQLFQTLARLS